MKKLLLSCILGVWLFLFFWEFIFAAAVNIPGADAIEKLSLDDRGGSSIAGNIYTLGFQILSLAVKILQGLIVVFIVWIGVMMIISMGSDEEQLSAAKRQIWYALIAFFFINIPWTIFLAFYKDWGTRIWNNVSGTFDNPNVNSNIFFNFWIFNGTVNGLIGFLEVMIFLSAIFMITLAGIQVMTSRWKEEGMKNAKNKILYTILALIFVWIIEAWKRLAFGGNISDGVNLFESLANLALFFAVPIAFFFMTLAGYYYITANGDEERVKKAKSILINTVLATLILLASYSFLLELASF